MYLQSNSAKIEIIYLVKNHKAVKGTNQHKLLSNYPYLGQLESWCFLWAGINIFPS